MAATMLRTRDKDSLAQFLGWFSVGLGTAQVAAPRLMSRLVGASPEGAAPAVMRAMGVRELVQGFGILSRPRPTTWLWSRVAGDGVDMSLLILTALRNKGRRGRAAFALANVAAVTVPDVYESLHLRRLNGRPRAHMRIRKAVTINRPRDEVQQAWTAAEKLRQKVDKAGASVVITDAPGDRGTELAVEFVHAPLGGDLGAAVGKLTGHDLATQLSDDLRLLKQQVETGEIVHSEGAPEGHRLSNHLKQRPAQPTERRAA